MPFTAVDPLPSNVHVDLGQPFAVNVTLGGVVDGGGGGGGGGGWTALSAGGGGATPSTLELNSKFGVPARTELIAFGTALTMTADVTCAGVAVG
jgi:hypothetical protein